MVDWSSGYDIWFTPKRSPVQSRYRPYKLIKKKKKKN